MVNTTLQDAAPFVNPKNVVGNNSAGPVQTSIFPNFGAVPNMFGNNKVFLTDSMYDGTTSNVIAAGGKYSGSGAPLTGGRRRKRRQSKGKRSNAGMHKTAKKSSPKRRSSSPKKHSTPHAKSGECRYCDYGDEGEHKQSPSNLCRECQDYARKRGLLYGGVGKRLQVMGPVSQSPDALTANGGRVGAGHPQVATYNHSGSVGGSYKKRRSPKRRKSSKRRSRRGGMGCSGKKHRHRKGKSSKRRSRRGGMGCSGNKHRHSKKKRSKRSRRYSRNKRGGCEHLLASHKKGGSGKQLEFAQGFGLDGKNDTNFGALSSPIPIKAYNSCGVVSPRN